MSFSMKAGIKTNNNLKFTSIGQRYIELFPQKEIVRKYKVIAITVSVNYSDYLKTIIDNAKQLDRWFIVTSSDDQDTINLVKSSGHDNIELIFFNFKSFGVFNKGGGLRLGQSTAYKYLETELKNKDQIGDYCFLILDSDISLSSNFLNDLCYYHLQSHTIYGAYRRDYHTLSDFIEDKNPQRYPAYICGYFQLYSAVDSNKYLYQDSFDCGGCDNIFRDIFKNKVLLNINVKHIGQPEINWKGRKTKNLN